MIAAPGAGADAVVWPEVAQRAYADSELTWTYLRMLTIEQSLEVYLETERKEQVPAPAPSARPSRSCASWRAND